MQHKHSKKEEKQHYVSLLNHSGEMAERSIASDLKSEEPKRLREFESHSLLKYFPIQLDRLDQRKTTVRFFNTLSV